MINTALIKYFLVKQLLGDQLDSELGDILADIVNIETSEDEIVDIEDTCEYTLKNIIAQ